MKNKENVIIVKFYTIGFIDIIVPLVESGRITNMFILYKKIFKKFNAKKKLKCIIKYLTVI